MRTLFGMGQNLSLIDAKQTCAVKLTESTLQISILDLVSFYVFKGYNVSPMTAISVIPNDSIGYALSEVQKLLGEYVTWLQSNYACEGRLYLESFENIWPSFVNLQNHVELEIDVYLGKKYELSTKMIENFKVAAAHKLLEQQIGELFLGSFGGIGAVGLSPSFLAYVMPTILEDKIDILSSLKSVDTNTQVQGRAVSQVNGNQETMSIEGDFKYIEYWL